MVPLTVRSAPSMRWYATSAELRGRYRWMQAVQAVRSHNKHMQQCLGHVFSCTWGMHQQRGLKAG